MSQYNETWMNQKVATLKPILETNFRWLLSARTQDDQVKMPIHLESGWQVGYYGIKEVTKGGSEGETVIAGSKPVLRCLVILLPAQSPFDLAAALPRLGRMLTTHLSDRPGQITMKQSDAQAGLSLSVAQTTPAALMWTWTWPA